jgi:hypothetical protein
MAWGGHFIGESFLDVLKLIIEKKDLPSLK